MVTCSTVLTWVASSVFEARACGCVNSAVSPPTTTIPLMLNYTRARGVCDYRARLKGLRERRTICLDDDLVSNIDWLCSAPTHPLRSKTAWLTLWQALLTIWFDRSMAHGLSVYVCSDGKNKYFVLGQRISLSNLFGRRRRCKWSSLNAWCLSSQ